MMQSFLQLAGKSETALVGRIVDLKNDAATIQVSETIFGPPVAGVISVAPMSTADCLGRSSSAAAGQEVVLLLKTTGPKQYAVVGDGEGKMTLRQANRAADLEAARKLIEHSRLKDLDKLHRAMLALVKSRNDILRREACNYVAVEIGNAGNRRDYADQLIAMLALDDKDARFSALIALRDLRVEKAIPSLIQLTRGTDARLADAASVALGQYDTPESVRALLGLLHGPDVALRQRAAIDLGNNSRRPEAKAALVALLDDPDPRLREMAPRRLTKWLWAEKAEDVVPKLISMLDDPQVKIQTAAAETLGESRLPSIVQPLLDVLARPHLNPTLEVRTLGSLSQAYDRNGTGAVEIIHRGLPRLVAVLERGDNVGGELRTIDLLGRTRTPEALAALKRAAESHPHQETREAARQVLERLAAVR